MEDNILGELIRKGRIEKGVTKKALSRGLCSITSLTRYEEGERIPGKFLADSLLERLGMTPYKYEFIMTDDEFRYGQMRRMIDRMIKNGDKEPAVGYLEEYRREAGKEGKLHEQYLALKAAEIALLNGKGNLQLSGEEVSCDLLAETEEKLRAAMELTSCDLFSENNKGEDKLLLTNMEMQLLYYLADCLYREGKTSEAYKLYGYLERYLITREWDYKKTGEYYPWILYRLAQGEEWQHNFGKALTDLERAERLLRQEFKIDGLYEIMKSKEKLKELWNQKADIENDKDRDFLLALAIIDSSDGGILTQESVKMWERMHG